jgi:hypothetical protein
MLSSFTFFDDSTIPAYVFALEGEQWAGFLSEVSCESPGRTMTSLGTAKAIFQFE